MRLKVGGTFLASSDNYKDTWLRDQLQLLSSRCRAAFPPRRGRLRGARKTAPLNGNGTSSPTSPSATRQRLVKAVSRPGVFSHRKLDLGARGALEVMEIREGDRVLDIGCGSRRGRAGGSPCGMPGVEVEGIDSNCRAIAALRKERNSTA